VSIALVRYDAACHALAEAKAVDEVKKILDVSEAMRAYAKQAKNKQLEVDAAEIRFRAERRIGELMQAQRETVGLSEGTKGQLRGKDSSGGTLADPPDARPTLAEAGIDKHLADRARKLAAVPQEQFENMVGEWRGRVQEETERVTTNLIRAGEREQKKVERPSRPLPDGKYRLIYADPPWRYEHIETESRAIENQYPTMSLDEICALPVPAADDSVLFLWATSPKLHEAMTVIDTWGFDYRTCAVWDKEKIGMGYYFRQQHELLLVAARGALPVPEPSDRVSSIIRIKRPGIHSRKPTQVIEMLEAMYPHLTKHERIELFTREPRVGWAAWGNEPAA
jgi:N6-adenosine-specific RNA methylase IME4